MEEYRSVYNRFMLCLHWRNAALLIRLSGECLLAHSNYQSPRIPSVAVAIRFREDPEFPRVRKWNFCLYVRAPVRIIPNITVAAVKWAFKRALEVEWVSSLCCGDSHCTTCSLDNWEPKRLSVDWTLYKLRDSLFDNIQRKMFRWLAVQMHMRNSNNSAGMRSLAMLKPRVSRALFFHCTYNWTTRQSFGRIELHSVPPTISSLLVDAGQRVCAKRGKCTLRVRIANPPEYTALS